MFIDFFVVLLLTRDPTRAAAIAIPRRRAASRYKIVYGHEQQDFAKHLHSIFVNV